MLSVEIDGSVVEVVVFVFGLERWCRVGCMRTGELLDRYSIKRR